MLYYFLFLILAFFLIFRKGYVKKILIFSCGIGIATFLATFVLLKFPLELCLFQTITTFIIWYMMIQIFYGIARNFRKSPK